MVYANLALAIGLSSKPSLYQRMDGLGRPCVSHSSKVIVLAVYHWGLWWVVLKIQKI